MVLTKEQIEDLKHDINFQMSCSLDVAGKKGIKVRDLFDTILAERRVVAEYQRRGASDAK